MKSRAKYLFTLSLGTLLTACGGGGGGDVYDAGTDSGNKITLSGSVGDGPIVGATVTLKSRTGAVLSTTTSSRQAAYTLSAQVVASDYPLLLEASQGIDLVTGTTPDFVLQSVVADRSVSHANLNPHSTLIVKTAVAMSGGISASNLVQARQIIISELNFGIDTDLVDDPVAAKIDSSNLPTITYASEALAEMLRRTRAALGTQVKLDTILNSLAADLADGILDAKGAAGTNLHYTTISQAVSVQVLLESMLQDLKVHGSSAELKLTDAINTVLGTSNKGTHSYRSKHIKWPMLRQARTALRSIQKIDPSLSLRDLHQAFIKLGQDATTDELIAALAQVGLDLSVCESLSDNIAQANETHTPTIGSDNNPEDSQPDAETTGTEQQVVVVGDSNENSNESPPAPAPDIETDEATTPVVEENNPQPVPTPPANNIPVISGTPATSIAEGEHYLFTPAASDTDGDNLAFSITHLPLWADFNTTTGTVSGTPDFTDAGSYTNIIISATDGTATTSLTPFNIQVNQTNLPPTITGNPVTSVTAGEEYFFTPQSSDPDYDGLSFSVSNLPTWLDFDSATGKLSGTPDANDVGIYQDIVISVSDGKAGVALDSIAITVNANSVSTRSANLSWEIPTTRTNGSPLTLSEIAGYRIYMGLTSNDLSMTLDLNDGSITSHSLSDLTPGTYYFSVTTYDTEGNESAFSNIAQKTII